MTRRRHIMPRAMPEDLILDIVQGFGQTAVFAQETGLDAVEICASHGYLPAQFMSPRLNLRSDRYGGSLQNRLRFLRETLDAITTRANGLTVGLRLSIDEVSPDGCREADILQACQILEEDGSLDYVSLVMGSVATLGAARHVVPPMELECGHIALRAEAIKAVVSVPVMIAGRINQPQIAEEILSRGQADLCGMTRAMICDPNMPEKARSARHEDIRACIGCNQACTGHGLKEMPISCIQHPESARERRFGTLMPADREKRVLVVGGGPGGLKAAAVAAARGHRVRLCEQAPQLGGQVLLAQRLPGRTEFGGLITNLARNELA